MQVNGLPIRVVSRVEGTILRLKLVAEDELPLSLARDGCPGHGVGGSVLVYQAVVSRYFGYLAGTVDTCVEVNVCSDLDDFHSTHRPS